MFLVVAAAAWAGCLRARWAKRNGKVELVEMSGRGFFGGCPGALSPVPGSPQPSNSQSENRGRDPWIDTTGTTGPAESRLYCNTVDCLQTKVVITQVPAPIPLSSQDCLLWTEDWPEELDLLNAVSLI